MGNTCWTRPKASSLPQYSESFESSMKAYIFQQLKEVELNSITQIKFFIESNRNYEILLNFVFKEKLSDDEVELINHELITIHDYQKISFEFGPYLTENQAFQFIYQSNLLNNIMFLRFNFNENTELDNKTLDLIASCINSSNFFGIKELDLTLKKSKIIDINKICLSILERKSFEKISLDLSYNNLHDEDFQNIINFMHGNLNIKYLMINFSGNSVHEEGLESLFKELDENKNITKGKFILKDNKFNINNAHQENYITKLEKYKNKYEIVL